MASLMISASSRLAGRRHQSRFSGSRCRLTVDTPPDSLIDLDAALVKLAREDETKAALVKLIYFSGLTLEHAAAVLGISRATAARYWAYARAWLYDEINA